MMQQMWPGVPPSQPGRYTMTPQQVRDEYARDQMEMFGQYHEELIRQAESEIMRKLAAEAAAKRRWLDALNARVGPRTGGMGFLP